MKKYIKMINSRVAYEVTNEEDCVKAIKEVYAKSDSGIGELLESMELVGFSIDATVNIFAEVLDEIDGDKLIQFYSTESFTTDINIRDKCIVRGITPKCIDAKEINLNESKAVLDKNIVSADLDSKEKNTLIKLFYDLYYNTDQDEADFGLEYYHLTSYIVDGYIPLRLRNLVDFEEEVVKAIPRLKKYYQ